MVPVHGPMEHDVVFTHGWMDGLLNYTQKLGFTKQPVLHIHVSSDTMSILGAFVKAVTVCILRSGAGVRLSYSPNRRQTRSDARVGDI